MPEEGGSKGSWKGPIINSVRAVEYPRRSGALAESLSRRPGRWRCLAVSDDGDGAVFGLGLV